MSGSGRWLLKTEPTAFSWDELVRVVDAVMADVPRDAETIGEIV